MSPDKSTREQWRNAYDDMLVRVKTALEEAEEATLPLVQRLIHGARDSAVELGELTREEAEKIADWLSRDLHDAGRHLAETGQELGDWLRFDTHQIEDRLLEALLRAADQTRLEMLDFQREITTGPVWNSGEISGPGTLTCDSCGSAVRFHATGVIPDCPNCGHTVFHRQQYRR